MSNEIVEAGGDIKAIIPQSGQQIMQIAGMLVKSGMVPKAYHGNRDAIVAAIMHGLEVGLPPMAALQNIAVINGMPSLWGDGALALIQNSGVIEDIEETIEGEDEGIIATCRIKRTDRKTETIRTFSAQDAIKAGLWGKDKTPWRTYPKRMCQMRARSWAMRDACPDILKGLHIAEEMQDTGGEYGAEPVPTQPRPERPVEPAEPEADNIVDAEVEEVQETENPEPEEVAEAITYTHIHADGQPGDTFFDALDYIKSIYDEGSNTGGCAEMVALYEHNAADLNECMAFLSDDQLTKYYDPIKDGYDKCIAKLKAEAEKAEQGGGD